LKPLTDVCESLAISQFSKCSACGSSELIWRWDALL